MFEDAFRVEAPRVHASPVVFASPHSGRHYRQDFLRASVLDAKAIRSSEDAYVDDLIAPAPRFGVPLLLAGAPRAYVDLNRASDELDAALIEGLRPYGHNPRVASGLGVIPRVVSNGRGIYRGKISRAEADYRIETYWRPYHKTLQDLLDASIVRFGTTVLVDWHSMPHEAMDGIAKNSVKRPNVVLGDRFGASAGSDIVDQIDEAFSAAGFVVARNSPFAGAYIAQTYGRPSRGQHAVQVEIDRSLYMDERLIRKNDQFEDVAARLSRVIAQIAAIGQDRVPLAAE